MLGVDVGGAISAKGGRSSNDGRDGFDISFSSSGRLPKEFV